MGGREARAREYCTNWGASCSDACYLWLTEDGSVECCTQHLAFWGALEYVSRVQYGDAGLLSSCAPELRARPTPPTQVLCKGFPQEFVTYFQYVRSLRFDEKPDYAYLRRLFRDLFAKEGVTSAAAMMLAAAITLAAVIAPAAAVTLAAACTETCPAAVTSLPLHTSLLGCPCTLRRRKCAVTSSSEVPITAHTGLPIPFVCGCARFVQAGTGTLCLTGPFSSTRGQRRAAALKGSRTQRTRQRRRRGQRCRMQMRRQRHASAGACLRPL